MMRVTPDELDRVAGVLHASAAGIAGDNAHGFSLVNALAREGWQGAASAQFVELFTQWRHSAEQLTDALTRIGGLLQDASATYVATEETVRRSMQID